MNDVKIHGGISGVQYYFKSARYTNFGNLIPTTTSYKTLITKKGIITQWAVWSKESAKVQFDVKINGESESGNRPYLSLDETQRIEMADWSDLYVEVGDELEFIVETNDNSTELLVELQIKY